jgi:hypothetical protein
LPIDPALKTTFTFDAFAGTTFHNQFIGLHPLGARSPNSDAIFWDVNANLGNGWEFVPGGPLLTSFVAGGINQPVKLGIVMDGTTNELYGLYDFNGAGFLETQRYPITTARIATMNSLNIYVDHRNNPDRGIEADNFLVTEVPAPEPTASGMILAMGAGTMARRRRKRALEPGVRRS